MPALVFFYTETPLHAGAGTRVSYVDLPVQRERITNYPMIQSSSLKGVLRWEAFQAAKAERDGWDFKKVAVLFGPGEDLKKHSQDPDLKKLESSEFGGAVALTDARLLLFPVRSLRGVFAWVTCPLALKRLARDLQTLGRDASSSHGVDLKKLASRSPNDDEIILGKPSDLDLKLGDVQSVVLEDFRFTVKPEETELSAFAEFLAEFYREDNPVCDELPRRIAMVSDNVFQEMVEMTTEVISRIRIDQVTGTVAEGALWTEELVPSETLFWNVIHINEPVKKWNVESRELLENLLRKITDGRVLQFGGDETLGRGWLRLRWWNGESPETGGES